MAHESLSLIDFFLDLQERKGDVAVYLISGRPAILLNHPEVLEEVLVGRATQYSRDDSHWQFATPLLTLAGRAFVRRSGPEDVCAEMGRRIASGIAGEIEQLLSNGNDIIDLVSIAHRVGLHIMSGILFGFDMTDDASEFLSAALSVEVINMRRRAALHMSRVLAEEPGAEARLQQGIATLVRIGAKVYAQARAKRDLPPNMDDLCVARGVAELLLFSYESFANAISFGVALLGHEPDAADGLRRLATSGNNGHDNGPPLGEMVVQEILRMFPPAWMTARRAISDDVVAGVPIPAGTVIVVCPYTLHRNPRYWLNPNVFDPSRFAMTAGANRSAFRPFGVGPRMCTASGFAIGQLAYVLAELLSGHDFHITTGPLLPIQLVSLRPEITGRVRVSRRVRGLI